MENRLSLIAALPVFNPANVLVGTKGATTGIYVVRSAGAEGNGRTHGNKFAHAFAVKPVCCCEYLLCSINLHTCQASRMQKWIVGFTNTNGVLQHKGIADWRRWMGSGLFVPMMEKRAKMLFPMQDEFLHIDTFNRLESSYEISRWGIL